MPAEGRGLGSRATQEGGKDGWRLARSLLAPELVRRLQRALHAKAKGDPGCRFYALSDKVWREDVLAAAWQAVRRNGGASGVDGETFERIEERGAERWLGELADELGCKSRSWWWRS